MHQQRSTVLITGATGTLGGAVARYLARAGHQVVLSGRSSQRGERLRREIVDQTRNREVTFIAADLAELDAIRSLGDQVAHHFPQLNGLIHCASTLPPQLITNSRRLEQQFAVNHLAPFALTTLLAQRLRANAPARVVIATSSAHFGVRPDFYNMLAESGYNAACAYERSMLFNVLLTYELARRFAATGIVANAFAPGTVDTPLFWNHRRACGGRLRRLRTDLIRGLRRLPAARTLLGGNPRPIDEAAYMLARLATAAEFAAITGRYFEGHQNRSSSPESYSREAAARLWELSERLVGESWPRLARSIVDEPGPVSEQRA